MSKELEQLEKWINKQQFEVSGKGHYIDAIPLLQKLSELKASEVDYQSQEPKQREVNEAVEFVDWINNNEITDELNNKFKTYEPTTNRNIRSISSIIIK